MQTDRRKLLQALPLLAGLTLTQPLTADAATGGKPLTTASLAKSLLTLADKAELQGMRREAQAIYAAVKIVMDGSPAKLAKGGKDGQS